MNAGRADGVVPWGVDVSPSAGPAPVQFGKYWLDAELAVGGMARLFRARLRGPGGFEKKLAVKQILPQLAGDPSFVELLVREANTLVQMSHPNIVPIYELGVVEGVYFLAMELVEGATVAELLDEGPLDLPSCAQIGVQVCEALRYAHERFALVHRDVTPRNVIVDRDGHVRLLDFGIAAPLASTGGGPRFGSPGYMSPEQARGDALNPRSDLFSLGTVLHEALTGALPDAASAAARARLHASARELAPLFEAMLEPDPSARPDSATEVAARLRAWLAKSHPEGARVALGARAEQARGRGGGAAQLALSEGSEATGVSRSIATSTALTQMLAGDEAAALQLADAPPHPRTERVSDSGRPSSTRRKQDLTASIDSRPQSAIISGAREAVLEAAPRDLRSHALVRAPDESSTHDRTTAAADARAVAGAENMHGASAARAATQNTATDATRSHSITEPLGRTEPLAATELLAGTRFGGSKPPRMARGRSARVSWRAGAVVAVALGGALLVWRGASKHPDAPRTGAPRGEPPAAVVPQAPQPSSAAASRGAPAEAAQPPPAPDGSLAAHARSEPLQARSGTSRPQAQTSQPRVEISQPRAGATRGRAFLSVNALPWAEVRLDDRVLGSTPQRSLPVAAGEHVLVVSCPPLGRSERVALKLAAAGRYQVLIDLQTTPARVSIR